MNPIPINKETRKKKAFTSSDPSNGPPRSKWIASQHVPGLYIVSTPIGNLADISNRAAEILAAADIIACEDTRVTGKLLKAYDITTPMKAYHDHSLSSVRDRLISRLINGETVALVSDAGTPLISDPGFKLLSAALAADITVTAAPGPAAPIVALVLSGLPTNRFFFGGYLPVKKKQRLKALEEVRALNATLLFLESPKRLALSLETMLEVLGDRKAAVARELTKLHEEVNRAHLSELAKYYKGARIPRGELVVVLAPPVHQPVGPATIDALLEGYLDRMTVKDAVGAVVSQTGASRKTVYARALTLSAAMEEKEPKGD